MGQADVGPGLRLVSGALISIRNLAHETCHMALDAMEAISARLLRAKHRMSICSRHALFFTCCMQSAFGVQGHEAGLQVST